MAPLSAVSLCERIAVFFGGVIFIGVTFEIVLAFGHFPLIEPLGYWGPVWADALVAIGVGLEVAFGFRGSGLQSELTRRSNALLAAALRVATEANARAAAANERAAKAELQLAPRSLAREQVEQLLELKGVVSAVTVTCAADFESTRFAAQIGMALQYAGVEVHSGQPRIGLTWSGVYIVVPTKPTEFIKEPLYQAFSKAGIAVGCGDRSQTPLADLSPDLPVIMVGEKGFTYPTIPYVAGFNPAAMKASK